mmetsp:Transcript_31612/g.62527  ORF Transcript_31612/g.62527 Transcript_31612/m.62527 type:complete len:490 (-) Transcript_31612:102-1571(-)
MGHLHQGKLGGRAGTLKLIGIGLGVAVDRDKLGGAAEHQGTQGVTQEGRVRSAEVSEGGGPGGTAVVTGAVRDELLVGASVGIAQHEAGRSHVAFRQGTGLVRADIRDLAELLQSSHVPHNGVGCSHASDRNSHGDGDEHNGGLRQNGNQGGGGVQESLVVDRTVGHHDLPTEGCEDEDTEDDANNQKEVHEVLHGHRQCGLLLASTLGELRSDLSDLSLLSNAHNHTAAGTLRDGGLTEAHVGPVTHGDVKLSFLGGREGSEGLHDRNTLASQNSLVDLKTVDLHETEVSRDDISRLQFDDVTDDHVTKRNGLLAAISDDSGIGGTTQMPDGCHALFGLPFLNDRHASVEENDNHNHNCLNPLLDAAGKDEHSSQNGCKRVAEVPEDDRDQRLAMSLCKLVGTIQLALLGHPLLVRRVGSTYSVVDVVSWEKVGFAGIRYRNVIVGTGTALGQDRRRSNELCGHARLESRVKRGKGQLGLCGFLFFFA